MRNEAGWRKLVVEVWDVKGKERKMEHDDGKAKGNMED